MRRTRTRNRDERNGKPIQIRPGVDVVRCCLLACACLLHRVRMPLTESAPPSSSRGPKCKCVFSQSQSPDMSSRQLGYSRPCASADLTPVRWITHAWDPRARERRCGTRFLSVLTAGNNDPAGREVGGGGRAKAVLYPQYRRLAISPDGTGPDHTRPH